MLSDFFFVCRSLFRNRGFTFVTVFTLAAGIGAATAIFSVTDYLLFRARSFPDGVYLISGVGERGNFLPIRFPFMVRAYEQARAMGEFAKLSQTSGNIVVDRQPVGVTWNKITPNLFPMLKIPTALGRGFLPSDSQPGASPVAIVTSDFWKSKLGGSAGAIGQKITLGTDIATVVGILPADPALPPFFWSQVYEPMEEKPGPQTNPASPQYWVLGRPLAGDSPAQARDRLQAAQRDIPAALRGFVTHERVTLSSLADLDDRFLNTDAYWAMLGAVALLYAIACLNASNIVLVRMLGRRRELSIRLALGGGSWRVIRLLGLESVMLSILGAAGAYLIAHWVFPFLLRGQFGYNLEAVSLSGRAAAVMGALTVITSLLIIIGPAVRVLKADLQAGLKDGGSSLGESRRLAQIRGGLVIIQIAMAIVLLCSAGLMIRTFQNFERIDLGFDPVGRAKIQLAFSADAPAGKDARLARLREVARVIGQTPGVGAVGFGTDALLPGYHYEGGEVTLSGGQKVNNYVTEMLGENYQDAAGIRLLRGTWLSNRQGDHVLISATFARTYFKDRDPVGQFLRPSGNDNPSKTWKGWCIDGVVSDLRPSMHDAPGNVIYGPQEWNPEMLNTFVVRLSRPYGPDIANLIRKRLYAFDPQLVVTSVQSFAETRDTQLWAERQTDIVLRVLSVSAGLLTAVGIFSVLAYAVSQRMTEFGLRVALGATQGNLISLVVGRGLKLALVGLVVGMVGAFFVARLLSHVIYDTSATDPLLLTGVAAILFALVVAACALPAYRASRADAARLLRAE